MRWDRSLIGAAMATMMVAVSTVALAQAQGLPDRGPARLEVTTRPSAVAVYADQATVTRTGTVDLPAGDSILVLSGVPAGLLPDSVSARGRASAQVTIGAVELRQATFDATPFNRRRAALEAQVRELDDQLTAIDVRHNAAVAQQQMIERLAASFADAQRRPPGPNEPPRPAIDPSAWRTAWELVRDGTAETGEAVRRARLERRAIEERKAALQAEIASLGQPPARGALEIAVSVRTDAATQLALEVSYQVRNAAWRPVYEARLDTANARLSLRQEAVVTQATGEDWGDVALTLSTARPSAGTQPPQLAPWRITLAPPQPPQPVGGYARAPATAPAPPPVVAQRGQNEVGDDRRDTTRREAQVENAALVTVGFAVEYQIPGTATVRSDGSERRVRIAELPVDVTMIAQAIPRLDRRAFLRAGFANPAQVPLLPGQVTLVLDGVQVGRAPLPLLRPTEQTALAFGADDRIRVAYEPQPQRRQDAGNIISGRTTIVQNEALITVQSFHVRPIEITVLDQAPVSSEETLVVQTTADPQPTARDVDERPGVLAWTATYAPREQRRIRFGYSISSPRDSTVYGMR